MLWKIYPIALVAILALPVQALDRIVLKSGNEIHCKILSYCNSPSLVAKTPRWVFKYADLNGEEKIVDLVIIKEVIFGHETPFLEKESLLDDEEQAAEKSEKEKLVYCQKWGSCLFKDKLTDQTCRMLDVWSRMHVDDHEMWFFGAGTGCTQKFSVELKEGEFWGPLFITMADCDISAYIMESGTQETELYFEKRKGGEGKGVITKSLFKNFLSKGGTYNVMVVCNDPNGIWVIKIAEHQRLTD
jgi:hypothetical protein